MHSTVGDPTHTNDESALEFQFHRQKEHVKKRETFYPSYHWIAGLSVLIWKDLLICLCPISVVLSDADDWNACGCGMNKFKKQHSNWCVLSWSWNERFLLALYLIEAAWLYNGQTTNSINREAPQNHNTLTYFHNSEFVSFTECLPVFAKLSWIASKLHMFQKKC